MNKDLDYLLVKRFPKIFADRNGNPSTTAMCWGFSCEDGWFNIIYNLCSLIQSHVDRSIEDHERDLKFQKAIDENDEENIPYWFKQKRQADASYTLNIHPILPQVVAMQVKEKFGSLRFYVNSGDTAVYAFIDMAESMSCVTCEVCGKPGHTRQGGWIKTLCDEHAKENDETSENFDVGSFGTVLLLGEILDGTITEVLPDNQFILTTNNWRTKTKTRHRAVYIKNEFQSYFDSLEELTD